MIKSIKVIAVVLMHVIGVYEFLSGNKELGLLWVLFANVVTQRPVEITLVGENNKVVSSAEEPR